MTDMSNEKLIVESPSTYFPDGSLVTAWKTLKDKYEPKDQFSKINLIAKFNSYKRQEAPSVLEWVSEMQRMQKT